MLETFAALFAAHVVADFLVQTKGMVNRKTELGPMSGHIALVAVSAAIAIGFHGQDPNAWRALALLTVAHAMMDLAKTHLMPPDRLLPYLTDQAVHILTIVLLAHFFPGLVHDGFWRGVLGDDIRLLTLAYLLAGFGIFAVVAGNYAVQLLLSSLPPPPPAQDACPPMFGIPGKQAVTMTPAADQAQIALMERTAVRGCASASRRAAARAWNTPWTTSTEVDPNDEVVEQDGARVMIAPMAQMFLFGTEIDYETSLLESGFKFRNPNVADACGCGESIKFKDVEELEAERAAHLIPWRSRRAISTARWSFSPVSATSPRAR
jgi:iron-sulfur cluster assembly protein